MDRIEQLRQFIARSPGEAFPRYALALELKGKGDARGAAAELEEVLRLQPDYLAAYLQLGMLQQALERFEQARETFTRGQELARKQGNSRALSELSQALETLPR